jgi:hypothetical protein
VSLAGSVPSSATACASAPATHAASDADAEIEHPVRSHVVDPLRLSLEELAILLPRDRRADDPPDLDLDRGAHRATSAIASTMFW